MEIVTMGKVLVPAMIENLSDVYLVESSSRDGEVRSIRVEEALVDTGATMLSLPKTLIKDLGLKRRRTRTARTAAGTVSFGVYEAVRLTIHERDCVVEVYEIPDDCPVLVGQIPLEALDFVIDPVGQKLVGNPDHDGEHMIELF